MLLALLPFALGGPSRLGYAFLSGTEFAVREKATIDYVYVVGEAGLDPGDQLRVEDPVLHGARWSLYGVPQLDPSRCTPWDPAHVGSTSLITVSTTGPATLRLDRVNEDGAPVADDHAGSPAVSVWSVVRVERGALRAGDEVVLTYGDTSLNPDCGHELPPRALRALEWPLEVNVDGTWEPVTPTPTFSTLPLEEPARLWIVAPSQAEAGTPFKLRVAVLDAYGNAVESWRGTVTLGAEWGGASHTWTAEDRGVYDFFVTAAEPGIHRVAVTADFAAGQSNPVRVHAPGQAPARSVWWGDIHAHNGHSYLDADGSWVDDNVVYARDVVGLDFAAESMKAEPVQIRGEENWAILQDSCATQTVDGSFVYLLATEWMGGYTGTFDAGHHNFYYDSCDAPILSHLSERTPDGLGDFGSGNGPYEWAEARRLEGIETVIVPHATRYTGYHWGPASINNEWRTVAEVVSGWGISLDGVGEAGSIEDGLNSGQRMGFIGASDNHDGWMGNDVGTVTVGNGGQIGLTALLAPRLDRPSLFAALRDRYSYGTTGERILLDFSATDGDAALRSGGYYVARSPTFRVEVHGTDTVDAVHLLALETRETARVRFLTTWYPGVADFEGTWTWSDWDGTDHAVWAQVDQPPRGVDLPGEYAWASPIWFTRDCASGAEDPAGWCDAPSGDSGVTDSAPPPDAPSSDPPDTGPAEGRCGCALADRVAGAYAWALAGLVLARRRR